MRILRPTGDPDRFFEKLAQSPRAALLLDYDGTLAPFCIDPQEARPYAGVRAALDAIMAQHDTRVVLVSGRWTRDLLPVLGLKQIPEIWGSHGWERRFPDGRVEMARPAEAALCALVEADGWIDEVHARGGRSEFKPACLAIHWRGLDAASADDIAAIVTKNWALHGRDSGLELHHFDGGIELRVPGRHKGDVVQTIRAEMPDALLAYLGDDATDEDAFHALADTGLGVLVRKELHATAAGLWLAPPDELLDFLQRWTQVREGRHARA
ncbi:MAG TPA: trehalose-phosphatase [Acidiferrobacterales bacterium]|nr:trehalose-phosphatase [Acidiferrobacterales bacterium]